MLFQQLLRGRRPYNKYKNAARAFIHQRLHVINQHYQFGFNRVAIKNHSTRWGSCSKKKNLNFNYRLLFLPPELADYVVAHELCHLQELNHGPKFWELVAQTMPDYAVRRHQLRKILL
jgi:predicted metal-dependent hydrolase